MFILKKDCAEASAAMLDMDYFAAGGGPPKIISSDSTLQVRYGAIRQADY